MHPRSFAPALLLAVLLASAAAPAQAVDTTISLTIEGGPLSVSAPATFELDARKPGSTVSFVQEGVTVTDLRAGEVGWVAAASVSEPVDAAGKVLPLAGATYTAGQATAQGTSTVLSLGTVSGLPGDAPVQAATGVRGNNSARWDAAVVVGIPARPSTGVFAVTITHSVY